MNEHEGGDIVIHRGPKAWLKLYLSNGVDVRFELPFERPADVSAWVDEALASGFSVNAPGTEPGEHVEECGRVVRREKENDDRTFTPIVDLYPANERTTWRFLSVYLNTDDERAAFEQAAGVRLTDLKLYDGQSAIEVGKSAKLDQYVVKVRPFKVIYKDNPKHNVQEAEAARAAGKNYFVPKKLFVRWGGQAAPQPANGSPGGQQQAPPPEFTQAGGRQDRVPVPPPAQSMTPFDWDEWLAGSPHITELNRQLPMLKAVPEGPAKTRIKKSIHDYATRWGWKWDQTVNGYVAPPSVHGEIPF